MSHQYPEGYLQSQAEKEKALLEGSEEDSTPKKRGRKRKAECRHKEMLLYVLVLIASSDWVDIQCVQKVFKPWGSTVRKKLGLKRWASELCTQATAHAHYLSLSHVSVLLAACLSTFEWGNVYLCYVISGSNLDDKGVCE